MNNDKKIKTVRSEPPTKDLTEKKPSPKSKSSAAKKLSATEILLDAFVIRKDKDGNVKPASITKTKLEDLALFEEIEPIGSDSTNKIIEYAVQNDQRLDCLTRVFLGTVSASYRPAQQELWSFCIRVISSVWIHKHEGSLDLFRSIFEEDSENPHADPVHYLRESLNQKYKKRISGLTRSLAGSPELNSETNTPLTEPGVTSNQTNATSKRVLEQQKKNLLLIGAFWLEANKYIGIEETQKFLLNLAIENPSEKISLREVTSYLAQQCMQSTSPVIRTLSLSQAEIKRVSESNTHLKKELLNKDQQIAALGLKIDNQSAELSESTKTITSLQSEIDKLKQQLVELDLDERAKRTHLRDNENHVRAKAYNLLSGDVLDPLEISLSALNKEKPKTQIAVRKIELVIKNIERNLKWFSE